MLRAGRRRTWLGAAIAFVALALCLLAPFHSHSESAPHGAPCLFCSLAAAPALASAAPPIVLPQSVGRLAPLRPVDRPAEPLRPTHDGRAPPSPSFA